jgi:hypothetical protein
MSAEPRTFDLRLWLTADPSVLEVFFLDVVELAQRYYPGVEPRWYCERRDRHGLPRVHPPPRLDDAGDGGGGADTARR